MPRNIDVTALRSFVAVADTGGVTKASAHLNLTQSAVSMQIKRLEEGLGQRLFDRSGRGIALTTAGEQLLSYGRRILALNDEVWARMTDELYEGELVLGVPHDIVYPAIPKVLRRFNAAHPRMRVQLLSSYTVELKRLIAEGKCDVILGTEDTADAGAETLAVVPLVWYGASGGSAWRARPLRLAYPHNCRFRRNAQAALDAAGIRWEMAVESDSVRTVEASVVADLAIWAQLEGQQLDGIEKVDHGGALPDMGSSLINLYVTNAASSPVIDDLAALVRQAYGQTRPMALTA